VPLCVFCLGMASVSEPSRFSRLVESINVAVLGPEGKGGEPILRRYRGW
jgi:hypothetical protein